MRIWTHSKEKCGSVRTKCLPTLDHLEHLGSLCYYQLLLWIFSARLKCHLWSLDPINPYLLCLADCIGGGSNAWMKTTLSPLEWRWSRYPDEKWLKNKKNQTEFTQSLQSNQKVIKVIEFACNVLLITCSMGETWKKNTLCLKK